MKTAAFALVSALLAAGFAFAQDSSESITTDEDELFGGDTSSAVETAPEPSRSESPAEEPLRSSTIEWGGSFSPSFATTFSWSAYPPALEALGSPDATSLLTDLDGRLFFDARPDKGFRVFGKVKAAYPFQINAFGVPTPFSAPNIQIFELFSDFDWRDTLFLRVGKHTLKWGVGYFFSPADVLNLAPIDPEDPTAEREGPVSLKLQYPLGLNSLSLVVIANDITTPDRIGIAPKAEIVLGNWEVGVAGFYRKDLAPRGILTGSGPLFGLDLFAEGVVSWGADKTFLRKVTPSAGNPLGIETYTQKDVPFFSGTAGFTWSNPDWWSPSVMAQYFYNGYGYEDSSLLPDALVQVAAGTMSVQDLASFGRHYAAASAGLARIADSDVGVSVFWIGNLSDGSGQVSPSVSWQVLDHATVSLRFGFLYGAENQDLTPPGSSRFSVTLLATLGAGSF